MGDDTFRLWAEANTALDEEIPADEIQRAQPSKGIYGDYLRSALVIELLNQIFGPSGWSSEIKNITRVDMPDSSGVVVYAHVAISFTCIDGEWEKRVGNSEARDPWGVLHTVVREDIGVCMAQAAYDKAEKRYVPIKPQALDTAIKGAVSDGIKRVARQLGRRTGAQLYFEEREIVALYGEDTVEKTADEKPPKKEESKPVADFVIPQRDADGNVQVFDRKKPADEKVGSAPARVVSALAKQLLDQPHLNHQKHVDNHIRRWFRPAQDIKDLTWEQLMVMFYYGSTGEKPLPWYAEATVVAEGPDDVDVVAEYAELVIEKFDGKFTAKITEAFYEGGELSAADVKMILHILRKTLASREPEWIYSGGELTSDFKDLFVTMRELVREMNVPF